MSKKPKNIVFVVADSLRYDSVTGSPDCGMPYSTAHATRFSQARSAGCWTLPATASMFTGKLPHEHGATTQTRQIDPSRPTLAERMKAMGYRTIQVTANPVTTDIFGLDRGFDHVERVWTSSERRHRLLDTALAIAAKARVRRKLVTNTEDFVTGKMADDIEAASVWLQSNATYQFERAAEILEEANERGEPVFLFVNLMESHFPYHIDDTFKLSREGIIAKLRELVSLFHFVNQTRLLDDKKHIPNEMLEHLRERQKLSWQRLAPILDGFMRRAHEDTGNLVVFCSDHGDNFGEQGWQYHFSNVTDAGNRVPLYILDPEQDEERVIDQRISMRDMYGTLLLKSGAKPAPDLVDLTERTKREPTVIESFWYNRDGKTLPKYRFNQFAFVAGESKFIRRNDQWLSSQVANGIPESRFQPIGSGVDPIEDAELSNEERDYVRQRFDEYSEFSRRVLPASKRS